MNMACISKMSVLKEIFEYRTMIFSLVKKDLRARYKASVLGFLWTFINPLLQLIVYTFVFSIIMRSDIEQYYIFLFIALVPWIFFSSSLTAGAGSILAQKDMVKKIYFPREVIPISFVTTGFVNMLLTFLVVFLVLIVTGFGMNLEALAFLPIVMLIEYFFALGITLIVSGLTVFFRDLEYILGIITMIWQYLTPVLYSQSMVEEQLKDHPFMLKAWNLNPTTPIINAYREILYYKQIPDLANLTSAIVLGMVVCVIGFISFRNLQKGFAEVL